MQHSHLTKEIKNDTTELRNDTAAIKEDTSQILEEIAKLQARLPRDAAAAASNDFILQRFFEEMTTYTEQALDVALSDADGNSSKAVSFDGDPEERTTTFLPQNSWPYHSMPSSSRQSSHMESSTSNQIQNPYRDSDATSGTSFPTLLSENHGPREDPLDRQHSTYDEDADKNTATEHQKIVGFEIPVSEQVRKRGGLRGREFTHRRHSTIACSPEEFEKLDFRFRLVGFRPPRQIRLVLFFAIYPSEDVSSFLKRWRFLVASFYHLQTQAASSSHSWPASEDPCKQVLVHIQCTTTLDKMSPLVRETLYKMGILNTPEADEKLATQGTFQAEIFEVRSVDNTTSHAEAN